MALDAILNTTSDKRITFLQLCWEAKYFEPEITNFLVVLTNFTGLLPVYTQSLLKDEDTTTTTYLDVIFEMNMKMHATWQTPSQFHSVRRFVLCASIYPDIERFVHQRN